MWAKPRLLIALLLAVLACSTAAGGPTAGPQSSVTLHNDAIDDIVVAPNGKLVFTVCDDGSVGVWDAASLEQLRLIRLANEEQSGLEAIAVHPNLPLVAAATGSWSEPRVYVIDYTNGEIKAVLSDHTSQLAALAFSPDGRYLATGAMDGDCNMYEVAGWNRVELLKQGCETVDALAWHPSRPGVLALGSYNNSLVEIWDISGEPRVLQSFVAQQDGVVNLAWLDKGRRLLSAGYDGYLRIWDPLNGSKLLEMVDRGPVAGPSAVNVKRRLAAMGLEDQTIEVFDLRDGSRKCYLEGVEYPAWGLAFDPRGKHLYAGGSNGALQRWRIKEICR